MHSVRQSQSFQARAIDVVRKFVQTVVVVDDHAFTEVVTVEHPEVLIPPNNAEPISAAGEDSPGGVPDGPVERESTALSVDAVRPSGQQPSDGRFDQAVVTADEGVIGSAGEVDVTLDARKLIQLYAREGVFCAVVEPTAQGEAWRTDTLAAAARADIVILDWVLHHDAGDRAIELIREIVQHEHGCRLRLILIYTGSPDTSNIASRIYSGCGTTLEREDDFTLVGQHLRIVVLAKESTVTVRTGNAVRLDDLPDRTFMEFARITAGLVSNVALNGISVLRENTHVLLARLHPELDPPFLTHRLLLPNPDDAVDFAADLVAQEVASLFHGFQIGTVAGSDAIKAWLEKDGGRLTPANAPKLNIDSIEKAQALLERGSVVWARENLPGDDERRAFEEEAHRSATALFAVSRARAADLDREFAYRASMVERYSAAEPSPVLTLGATLQEVGSEDFYVCIQPPCDCVRIKEKRRFFFLSSRENNRPNLIVFNGAKLMRLLVGDGVKDLREIKFEPNSHGVVEATLQDEVYVFADSDGKRYIWRGQMKFPQAQRLANQFGANLCRVGLDESEWLRRWSRSSRTVSAEFKSE